MMCGSLERAHANLDTIIGGEPLRHQRRQQNVGLSELFDNLRFHDLPTKWGKIDMPSIGDSFIAPDHS